MPGWIRSLWLRALGLTLALSLLTGARHRVRPGETYASVAAAFAVEEDALRRANPDIPELEAAQVITVPSSPSQQVWSAAHPYAPPAPTASDLQRQIASGDILLSENPRYPGYYFLWAGPDQDTLIGQAHPAKPGTRTLALQGMRRAPGSLIDALMAQKQLGKRRLVRPGKVYDFYVFPETGGHAGGPVGRTTSFKKPDIIVPCTCIPAAR